jgi:hypothetical protein
LVGVLATPVITGAVKVAPKVIPKLKDTIMPL